MDVKAIICENYSYKPGPLAPSRGRRGTLEMRAESNTLLTGIISLRYAKVIQTERHCSRCLELRAHKILK